MLNREGSQLVSPFEDESGLTPAGKTTPKSYISENQVSGRERARIIGMFWNIFALAFMADACALSLIKV